LKAAIQITLSNLAHVTLMQAAHAANLSTRHFSRRFKQETGLEWRQFRLHARLLWAMELLLESHLQITQVAYQVGFNNLSAFAKAFALLTGETPSCYRAKNCRLAIISTK
jgi:transcriptional regulator GlxA family with amidase domain